MNKAFWAEMRAACTVIAQHAETRVVWVTSDGKTFTAGLDLMDHTDSFLTANPDMDVARRAMRIEPEIRKYQHSFSLLESLPQPVIVSIQGACIGGGVDLITACDIRLASKDAWFSVKEVDIGICADVGTLQRLPRCVGNESLVREWCYTGRKISSEEALKAGLVSRVYESTSELLAGSLSLCMSIASKSPLAVTGTKRSLLFSRDHNVAEGLKQVASWNSVAFQAPDMMAAMQASLAKQKALYSNL